MNHFPYFYPLGYLCVDAPCSTHCFWCDQWVSAFITTAFMLFVPFYPFVMLLHLLGFGSLFDTALSVLFSMPQNSREVFFPLWALLAYIGLSIGAIWSKKLFWLLLGLASLYMVYLFIFVQ